MIDQCQFGAPGKHFRLVIVTSGYFQHLAIASAPHFLKADPYFHNMLDGLEPEDEVHVSYIGELNRKLNQK